MIKKSALILLASLSVSIQVQAQKARAGQLLSPELQQVRLISADNDTTTIAAVFAEVEQQIVFIDFWASWCGPCMKQMPYSKTLQQKFDGQSVVFAYFSTDENHMDWLNRKEKLKLTGLNYRIVSEDKVLLRNAFDIPGIPFYTIWSGKMEVLTPKAPWPSSGKKLEKELTHFLLDTE